MEGIQKTIHEALVDLAQKVRDGFYGRDDDFDAEAFCDDIQEVDDLAE